MLSPCVVACCVPRVVCSQVERVLFFYIFFLKVLARLGWTLKDADPEDNLAIFIKGNVTRPAAGGKRTRRTARTQHRTPPHTHDRTHADLLFLYCYLQRTSCWCWARAMGGSTCTTSPPPCVARPPPARSTSCPPASSTRANWYQFPVIVVSVVCAIAFVRVLRVCRASCVVR
jgi:hypothetical protein